MLWNYALRNRTNRTCYRIDGTTIFFGKSRNPHRKADAIPRIWRHVSSQHVQFEWEFAADMDKYTVLVVCGIFNELKNKNLVIVCGEDVIDVYSDSRIEI